MSLTILNGRLVELTGISHQSRGKAMIQRDIKVDELITALDLEPHVEGGYFRRTYQADHRNA